MLRKLWNQSQFRYSLLSAAVWGMVAHAYAFVHNFFSHDALNALYASAVEEHWKIELGRFLFPLYRMTLRNALSLPWVIGLYTILWGVFIVYLISKIFNLKSSASIFFAAGVLMVNRTVICLASTYIYELDIDMLSVLFAVLSVYLWKQHKWGFLFGALPLLGLFGIYQCNLSVAIVLILFSSVLTLVTEKDAFLPVLKRGLLSLVMIALGIILYFLVLKGVLFATGIELVQDSNNSITNALSFNSGVLGLIPRAYKDFFHSHFAASTVHPRPLASIALWLVWISAAVFFVLLCIRNVARMKSSILNLLLAAVLLILVPLGANASYVLNNGGVHDLMEYANWTTLLLPIILAESLFERTPEKTESAAKSGAIQSKSAAKSEASPSKSATKSEASQSTKPESASAAKTSLARVAVYVLLLIILIERTLVANSIYLKKEFEQQATLSIMTRVVYDLHQVEGYVPGETPICFIGEPNLPEEMPGFEDYYPYTGSWDHTAIASDTIIYYYHPYGAYFNYFLNEPARFCTPEEFKALKSNEGVLSSPIYPDSGAFFWVDGVLVIHLS